MKQSGSGPMLALVPMGLTLLAATLTWGPAAHAQDGCIPSRPDELQLIVAEAEDFLGQGNVRESLESVSRGESLLPCLTDSVAADNLGALFLVKGAALYRLGSKGRRDAEGAFRQAFIYDSEQVCDLRGLVSGAKSVCERAKGQVSDETLVEFDLINHHSGALVYVDGRRVKPERRGLIDVELVSGTHYLQVLSDEGFFSRTMVVTRDAPSFDLTEVLGAVPEASPELAPGSIRLQGLPPDAQVVVDGRERRDLPVLTQLDPGDHYLKVNSPSMGVMGFTVKVSPGEETVYAVILDSGSSSRSGGGISTPVIASYGATVALAAGAGASFFLSSSRYAEADEAFQSYLAINDDPAAIQSQYALAEELQSSGNLLQVAGLGLSGAAVLAGVAGTFFLIKGEGGLASGPVQIIPFASRGGDGPTGGLLFTARF